MTQAKGPRARVLVVEDEGYVRESLGEMLASRGYDVSLSAGVEAAMEVLARAPVDLVLTDLKLPGESGLGMIRKIRSRGADVPVVVLTGFGTIASAVECIRAGANDYILKPADPDTLEVALERALASGALRREVTYLRTAGASRTGETEPVGRSSAWLRVLDAVRAAAPSDSTILLLGESGTGKELVARMIHGLSARTANPYIRVNCAATPLEMWESEFFGHRRGAFTGASGIATVASGWRTGARFSWTRSASCRPRRRRRSCASCRTGSSSVWATSSRRVSTSGSSPQRTATSTRR